MRLSVLEDLEIVLREVPHELAARIGHDGVELDDLGTCAGDDVLRRGRSRADGEDESGGDRGGGTHARAD